MGGSNVVAGTEPRVVAVEEDMVLPRAVEDIAPRAGAMALLVAMVAIDTVAAEERQCKNLGAPEATVDSAGPTPMIL
jgi:hypothetical protein